MDTKQLTYGLNQASIGNPFASPTEEAEGDYFVGRKSVLTEMHRDIVFPNKISNYHVVGLPRIGKSSLLKAFRKKVQCYRHASEKSLKERQNMTDAQKMFLVDYGIIILKTIYKLINS